MTTEILFDAKRREYASYTLDALLTLQDRMTRNGTSGPRWDALNAELARRMAGGQREASN